MLFITQFSVLHDVNKNNLSFFTIQTEGLAEFYLGPLSPAALEACWGAWKVLCK